MNKKYIKNRLNKEINSIPIPNVLQDVVKKSDINSMHVNKRVQTTNNAKKPFVLRLLPMAMAFTMLLVILASSLYSVFPNSNLTVVSIDINPSLELTLNSKEEVVKTTAINEDAIAILENVDLTGQNLQTALNTLLSRAKQLNYLRDDMQNAAIFSVKNNNAEVRNAYKQHLQEGVNNFMNRNAISSAVIFEEYDEQLIEEFEEISEDFESNIKITPAKYKYIKRVLNEYPELNDYKEHLAKMNVRGLFTLLNNNSDTPIAEIIDDIVNNSWPPANSPDTPGNRPDRPIT